MQNMEKWAPSKYVFQGGRLRASSAGVGIGSRLAADSAAECYGRNIPLHASGRPIDLGCGEVPLFATYRPFVSEVVCVDWGHTEHDCSHLDHQCDLNPPLPFRDGEFNTIFLSDVLEHIAEPANLWGGMARFLSPGGKLLMSVPFYYWIHEKPYDYYRYTEFALRRFAERAGFKVLSIEATGGSAEVLSDIASKRLRSKFLVGPALAYMVYWLISAYRATPLGRRRSRKTGQLFPLGHFLVAERM